MKNLKDWTIGQWRWVQYLSLFSLLSFMLYMNYPLWHILIVSFMVGVLTAATHIRQTTMGLIFASLGNLHQAMTTFREENSVNRDLPN